MLKDLKEKIIQEGLTDIVNKIIVPYSGWEKRGTMAESQNVSFTTTVYRNATGIIRYKLLKMVFETKFTCPRTEDRPNLSLTSPKLQREIASYLS